MRRWLVMLLFRINIGEAGNEAYKLCSAFQDLIAVSLFSISDSVQL